jgi:hypothetical protein
MTVPTGRDHLERITLAAEGTIAASASLLSKMSNDLSLIGTSLSALFQAATCQRSCSKGPHILEALAGRSYNLAVAAYTLMLGGFYDEALLLIRSIGEISNIIAMSATDKDAIREWISSDFKTRLNKFSPSKVRKILQHRETEHPHFDGEWYSRLSEGYTHVTPSMKPNAHEENGQGHVGGTFQCDGLETVLGELETVLSVTALMICAFFKFNDLSAEIIPLTESVIAEAET